MIIAFDAYQTLTRATIGDDRLEILGLGLAGEAGEVVEIIKKHKGHGHELNRQQLCDELGDLLWYLARMADAANISLSDVATENIEKLRRRYPDGFSSYNSLNREPHSKICEVYGSVKCEECPQKGDYPLIK